MANIAHLPTRNFHRTHVGLQQPTRGPFCAQIGGVRRSATGCVPQICPHPLPPLLLWTLPQYGTLILDDLKCNITRSCPVQNGFELCAAASCIVALCVLFYAAGLFVAALCVCGALCKTSTLCVMYHNSLFGSVAPELLDGIASGCSFCLLNLVHL